MQRARFSPSIVGALALALTSAAYGCGDSSPITNGTTTGGTTSTGSAGGDGGGSATGVGGGATTTGAGGDATTSTSTTTGAGGDTGASTTTGAGGDTSTSTTAGTGGGGGGGPKNVVRFAALGDTGKGNQGQKDVAATMAAKCAKDGCDFVQLLGDNIYDSGVDGTDDPQWQEKFEQPYAALNFPFWVVLGNHDYGGNGAGTDFGKGQNEIDYTKVSSKWKLPSAYYKHSLAHVEFFGLDTNMAMFHQAGQQAKDVKAWITASQATWKIAMGHHPYYSNGPHGNAGEYDGLPFIPIANGAGVKNLLDDAVCGKADVYLSGHDHSIQLLVPTCGGSTELIVSGAGASSTEFEGDNPTHYQTLDIGFVYVVIEDNKLTFEVLDTTGAVTYTRTITK